ncbi:phosphotransferase [Dyadobacter sp. CY261]|uniref:phosphotransferase enzyme family protein n=1 Tax=Dyadobacter sp. CY261 TaxID=2907203 RepID=UPI001F273F8A|nr:phosphotransferase [Dyadobacter sp. CY261]MCF0075483.1 phosphotransferase [Dyadobacter sp. CY261]
MKSIFPTIYSTLSPYALADLLDERYLLKTIQCTFLVRGVGDTYLVDSLQGRFILRIYRSTHRSLSHVQAEVALLMALKQAGVSVSYPIADRMQESIQQLDAVEGSRYAVLFSYAPGQPPRILNKSQLCTLGHEIARFHQVSSTIALPGERWTFDLDSTLFKPLEQLKSAFVTDQESYLWLQKAARQVETKIAQVNTSGFLSGYCHFDLLPKNMHFDGDSVTLFDFDFMGYGWLVHDLVCFWQHLALEVYAGRMTQLAFEEAYAIFLESYQSGHPISDQELALVPYLSLGFWLFYMGFHTTHDQFYSYLQPSQLKGYTGFLRHLAVAYWE